MNVLIFANHLNYGGIASYVVSLSGMLVKEEGVRVYVASRGGDLEEALRAMGVEHIRLPLTTKCEVSPKVFWSFLKLCFWLKRVPIDLFHANTRLTQVLAALLSLWTRRPYVCTCHGYFKTRFFRRILPCWGARVIAISDQVKDHLIRDFRVQAERVDLIYNGVDARAFSFGQGVRRREAKEGLGLDPSKKTVGHIGRLSGVKGQKFLVLAAEQILKKREDVQFLMVGDGPEEEPLRGLIRSKGLTSVVHIRSSAPTVISLGAMDVFVMPSVEEGLGISILEAQAAGVPVVASRVGGIPTVIEDRITGLLFAVGDVTGLAGRIEELLDDASLRSLLCGRARQQVVEKFSIQATALKTRRLYEAVLVRS